MEDNKQDVQDTSSIESTQEVKRKVGRPRKPDSEKVVYQRVPIMYETYKKMKEVTDEQGGTYTELIEAMALQTKVW